MTFQEYSAELKFRVTWILSEQSRESNIILMCIGALLAVGFMFGDVSNNTNYALINAFADTQTWTLMFGTYTATKLIGILWSIPRVFSTAASAFGVWAFNYIFLSFVIFDGTTIAPTELLLLVPTLLEFWTMISVPKNKKGIHYG